MPKNIPPLELKPEEKLVLLSAHVQQNDTTLSELDRCLCQITNWDYACKLLIDRAAAPLLISHLSTLEHASQIPGEVLYRLKQAAQKVLARSMVLSHSFVQIMTRFNQEGIPVIALKGIYLSEWLYGTMGLRQFSDLDLLVHPDACEKALDILESMGFQSEKLQLNTFFAKQSPFVHYPQMIKKGVSVEIHRHIHAAHEVYAVDLERMWQESIPIQLYGVDVRVFSPEDQLLHCCLHLDKHLQSGIFQFTCLYDLVNLIEHKKEVLNWSRFETICKVSKAESATYKYLSMVCSHFGVTLPDRMSELVSNTWTRKNEHAFNAVLRGKATVSVASSVFRTFCHIKRPLDRLHYVIDLLFPSVDFMQKRYRFTSHYPLLWYYPFRFAKAIKEVNRYIWK